MIRQETWSHITWFVLNLLRILVNQPVYYFLKSIEKQQLKIKETQNMSEEKLQMKRACLCTQRSRFS